MILKTLMPYLIVGIVLASIVSVVSLSVKIDSASPVITITSPTGTHAYLTNDELFSLGGMVYDDIGIAGMSWLNTESKESGNISAMPAISGNWNMSNIPLISGANRITIKAWDASGNSDTDAIKVTLDPVDPFCTIMSPTRYSKFATSSSSINISGISSDQLGVVSVDWYNGGNTATGIATGTNKWSVIGIPLKSGYNEIRIRSWDAAGNYGEGRINISSDHINPICTITSPTSNSTFLNGWNHINLAGTSSDNIGIIGIRWTNAANNITGTGYIGNDTAAWNVTGIPLEMGNNPITVTVWDAGGNSNSNTIAVNYDPNASICTITSPTNNPIYATNAASVNLAGNASDNIPIEVVTWKNMLTGGSGTCTGTTTWAQNAIPLNAGSNLIYVNATDTEGNTVSSAIFVNRDSISPTCTISSPTTNTTMTTGWHYISLNGTATDDIKVANVVWSNSLGGSGTSYMTPQLGDTSVSWRSNSNVHLLPGANVITVTAYDSAGNSKTDVLTVTYTGL